MTWTLGIAIAGLVVAVMGFMGFMIAMEALNRVMPDHKQRHEDITDMLIKYDFRIIALEKQNKALRKVLKDG